MFFDKRYIFAEKRIYRFAKKKKVFWDCFWSKKEYIVSPEKKVPWDYFWSKKEYITSPEQKSSSMLYCCLLSNKLFASTKYLFFQLLTVFIVASFLCWFRIISNNFKVSMLGNSFHKIAVQSQSQSQSGSYWPNHDRDHDRKCAGSLCSHDLSYQSQSSLTITIGPFLWLWLWLY